MLRATLLVLALLATPALLPASFAKEPVRKTSTAAHKNRPAWAELTAEQQAVLAPLKSEWDQLEPQRRRKWIGIVKRYPKMSREAQERVQRRMQIWANLSPEQRTQARENYRRLAKASREKRQKLRQQWAEYQALSPQERQRLRSVQR